MADKEVAAPPQKVHRSVRKYTFRGLDIDDLVKLSQDKLLELLRSRQRRKFNRGIKHKYNRLIMKIRKSKKNVQPGEKPVPVKTHLRNAVILPEMVGGVVGIHNGKEFTNVEIKFDMIGKYLGEFSLSYKMTTHGKPGVGATKGSAHVDKK